MKVNILNNHEVVLVDVPEDAHNIRVVNIGIKQTNPPYLEWEYYVDDTDSGTYDCVSIPNGDEWSILGPGTASQCSEEDAKVLYPKPVYEQSVKYGHHDQAVSDWYNTKHLESLHSYIRANGKEPGNIVIVYRKKN